MTLPSTIACGNIVRPTLNFNWYAVPESSRGNYHSVHNKSHNKHLENDFITHSASVKVSYDPSETPGEAVMKWKLYYAYDGMLIWQWAVRRYTSACMCLIGRCVNAAPQPWMEEHWDLLFPEAIIQICSVFQTNEWHEKAKYQNCIALHNGIPSEQGHVTMSHSPLPVLSLSICQWTWPPAL